MPENDFPDDINHMVSYGTIMTLGSVMCHNWSWIEHLKDFVMCHKQLWTPLYTKLEVLLGLPAHLG